MSGCRTVSGRSAQLRLANSAYPRIAVSGCAQFVAGVGEELAGVQLAHPPSRQRGGDMAEHSIERRSNQSNLRSRVGVGVRDPDAEDHLATVERQLGDPGPRSAATRRSGLQRQADDHAAGQARAGEARRGGPG